MSKRNPNTLGIWGPTGTRIVASKSAWKEPLKWDRFAKTCGERHRVFCASLADVFEAWDGPLLDSHSDTLFRCAQCQHDWSRNMANYDPTKGANACPACGIPGANDLSMNEVRRDLFTLIARTPHLDWLILTKRPGNAKAFFDKLSFDARGDCIPFARTDVPPTWNESPLGNVWLGVSAENQKTADERIPILLKTPAAIRFVSYEPALEPIDFALNKGQPRERLNWIIVGGESGKGARPFKIVWAEQTVKQCREAGVACFVKQIGSCVYDCLCKCEKCGHIDIDQGFDILGAEANNLFCTQCHAEGEHVHDVKDPKGGDPLEYKCRTNSQNNANQYQRCVSIKYRPQQTMENDNEPLPKRQDNQPRTFQQSGNSPLGRRERRGVPRRPASDLQQASWRRRIRRAGYRVHGGRNIPSGDVG